MKLRNKKTDEIVDFPKRYNSEIFKMYYNLEGERIRFEDIIDAPREFDNPKDEEAFYENVVHDYLLRIRNIIKLLPEVKNENQSHR